MQIPNGGAPDTPNASGIDSPWLKAWLALALTPAISTAVLRQLRQAIPDAFTLGGHLTQLLANELPPTAPLNNSLLRAMQHDKTRQRIEMTLEWRQQSSRHHLLTPDSLSYPAPLQTLTDAPPLLHLQGQLAALEGPCVAMVGARRASHAGREIAYEMATTLTQAGIQVVSGLAQGIDAAAHKGCLDAAGITIAVAATSSDQIYPRQHAALAEQITERGAILSEFPLGSQLQKYCFPRRNRLISGLCLGVVVVEAGLPSGSLTTADHAGRQGREVMAVPGSVRNPLNKGCHHLIRNGAGLVETAADVIQQLAPALRQALEIHEQPIPVPGDAIVDPSASSDVRPTDTKRSDCDTTTADQTDAQTLLNCLGTDTVSLNHLMTRSGLPVSRVSAAMSLLELQGQVSQDSTRGYASCLPVTNRPLNDS
ncbi:MAG: DNA-processing protein DprA [Granulosicoccus sp.]